MSLSASLLNSFPLTYVEIHCAGVRLVLGSWGEPPYCFQMAEEGSISTQGLLKRGRVDSSVITKAGTKHSVPTSTERNTYPDFLVRDDGDVRNVALRDGRKSYYELRPNPTASSFLHLRLLAPGNKVLVLVHAGHHRVHLLRSVPEHTENINQNR